MLNGFMEEITRNVTLAVVKRQLFSKDFSFKLVSYKKVTPSLFHQLFQNYECPF